jgi:hypothetical protein
VKKLGAKELSLQLEDLKLDRSKGVQERVQYHERVIEDKKRNLIEVLKCYFYKTMALNYFILEK